MKKILNYIIVGLLLWLVAVANGSLFGIKFSDEQETISFKNVTVPYTVVYTMPSAKNISGYGGPVPMAVAVDDNDVIRGIQVLKNAETPDYLNIALNGGYLNNWIGKTTKYAADNKVDAVSSATMSTSAISQSMQKRMQEYTGAAVEEQSFDYKSLWQSIAVLFVVIFGVLAFFFPQKFSKYRMFLLVSSIAILGLWQGHMLSTGKIFSWVLNGVPSIWGYVMVFVFVLSIALPYFFGRNFYCYNLCPFGAAQEVVGKAIDVKFNLTRYIFKGLEYARIVILSCCFFMLVFGMAAQISWLEPFGAFKFHYAPITTKIIFLVSLVLSVFIKRPWCKYFCPCGGLLDLFKRNIRK